MYKYGFIILYSNVAIYLKLLFQENRLPKTNPENQEESDLSNSYQHRQRQAVYQLPLNWLSRKAIIKLSIYISAP